MSARKVKAPVGQALLSLVAVPAVVAPGGAVAPKSAEPKLPKGQLEMFSAA